MSKSYINRLLSSYFWIGASFVVTMLKQIAIIPLFLSFWGKQNYTFWILIIATTNIAYTLNHGYLQYISNLVNITYHNTPERAARIVKSAFKILIFQSIILLGVVFVVSSPQILQILIGIDSNIIVENNIGKSFLYVAIASIFLFSCKGLIGKLFEPIGKIHLLYKFNFFQLFSELLLLIVLILLKVEVWKVALGFALVRVLAAIFLAILVKKALPDFFPWWKGGTLREGFRGFRKSIYLLASNFIERFQYDGLTVFVSNFVGEKLIPVYATTRTIGSSMISSLQLLVNPTLPDIQKSFAQKKYDRISQLLTINFFISGCVVNSVFLFVQPFMELLYSTWTNDVLVFDKLFYFYVVSYTILFCVAYNLFAYLRAINHTRTIFFIVLVKVVMIFIVPTLLIESLESIGIGMLASEIMGLILAIYFGVKELTKELSKIQAVKTVFWGILPSVYTILALRLFLQSNSLIIYALLLSILVFIYWIIWTLNASDLMKNTVRKVFTLRKR